MEYAKISRRALASLFDYFLIFSFTFFYILRFGEPNDEGTQSVRNSGTLPLVAVWVVYFPLLEALTGMTFGKFMANIRVCDLNGKKPTFFQTLKRHLIDPMEIIPLGIIAMIAARDNPQKQRVGDLWARTIVVSNVASNEVKKEPGVPVNQTEMPVFTNTDSQNIHPS